jgi:hypothetical protein
MSTMIEGEEEVGSKSLGWFVERNQKTQMRRHPDLRYRNDL